VRSPVAPPGSVAAAPGPVAASGVTPPVADPSSGTRPGSQGLAPVAGPAAGPGRTRPPVAGPSRARPATAPSRRRVPWGSIVALVLILVCGATAIILISHLFQGR